MVTKYTIIVKVRRQPDYIVKAMKSIYEALSKKNVPFLSVTFDNGIEFSNPVEMMSDEKTGEVKFMVYYARSYKSNDRPINEHINGELRRYFKKGYSIDGVTSDSVEIAQKYLNQMPRKILN